RVWNARGGSHTDGGAFLFSVERDAAGAGRLVCQDKFGRTIDIDEGAPPDSGVRPSSPRTSFPGGWEQTPEETLQAFVGALPRAGYHDVQGWLEGLVHRAVDDRSRAFAFEMLSLLIDRRYPCAALRRRSLLSIADDALSRLVETLARSPSDGFAYQAYAGRRAEAKQPEETLVLDGRSFPPDGPESLARAICDAVARGYRKIHVVHARGHRFLANGLGPGKEGVRIEVFGSPGDYLASGIDGVEMVVHADGQDQLAQIMKAGRLVVHGDVGQTFLYAAKGGEAFVLGNAAGRPLINAVGKPRVVINGTCLDYLAESFMAGDAMNGGGFAVLNGVAFRGDGRLMDLETPYPGGNLFSLASGGALFVRDPRRSLGEDQLNGGEFAAFTPAHWDLIQPLLKENERLFGIPVARLLEVDGTARPPHEVYRIIVPSGHTALQPEEAWVAHNRR
ncbi:MAG: glutamate synthase, partial [Anaerolineales bacterium]